MTFEQENYMQGLKQREQQNKGKILKQIEISTGIFIKSMLPSKRICCFAVTLNGDPVKISNEQFNKTADAPTAN